MSTLTDSVDDLFAPVPAAAPMATGGFVLCDFGDVSLAIPQSDVISIEHGGTLAAPLPGEPALGWFESAQGPWPVYALDDALELVNFLPPGRAFLAFLKAHPWPAGLACDGVRILRGRDEIAVQPLPAVMRGTGPVSGIAHRGADRIALVCGEAALGTHILERAGARGAM